LVALLVVVQPGSAGLSAWVGILNLETQWGDGEVRGTVNMGILVQSDLEQKIQPPAMINRTIAGYLVFTGRDAVWNGPVKVLDCAARLLGEQPRTSRHGEVNFLLSRNQENVQGIVTRRTTGTRGPRGFLQLPVPRDLQTYGQGAAPEATEGSRTSMESWRLLLAWRVLKRERSGFGEGEFQKTHVPMAGAFTIARPLV